MKNSSNRLIFPTFVCMEGSADKIFEVLKRYWGFTEFRPVQERIIRSAMAGRDTLALMPTGGGKSLTYQVPGLAQPGLCIVVTPLIALMKDQVDRLRARRIPAVAIHSGLSPRQIDIALDNCVYGDVKFLYVAPERLATEAFRRMGYAARFEPIDWEQKTALVESGTIDCIWGCFSMDGREEVYRWAGPYMVSRQVAAVDADSSIRTLGDLAGKTIAVQSTGKPEEIFLSGSDLRIPQTVEVFSTEDRSVQYAMLACGYVDAIAAHETAILQYMKDNSVEFRILEEPLLVTGLGIAFAKNDSRGLDIQLNAVLAQMRTDGTLEQILGKYLEHASQYLEVDTIGM